MMMGKALFVAAAVAMAGLGSQAAADEVPVYRGQAEVVGPAMLSLAGKRIVLYGVDAPVKGQPCHAGTKCLNLNRVSCIVLTMIVHGSR
jgi:hypothetical protein